MYNVLYMRRLCLWFTV